MTSPFSPSLLSMSCGLLFCLCTPSHHKTLEPNVHSTILADFLVTGLQMELRMFSVIPSSNQQSVPILLPKFYIVLFIQMFIIQVNKRS